MVKEHSFFPLKKLVILTLLNENNELSTLEIINKIKEYPMGTAQSLYNYKNQKIIKSREGNKDKIWYITKVGEERLLYLNTRLKEEFGGIEGLNAYIKQRKKEAIDNEKNKV